jgi:hypothetical protein
MAKIKTLDWSKRPRMEKLAAAMFPGHATPETQALMSRLAAAGRERPPQKPNLLPDAKRGACSPLGGLVKGWGTN